MCHSPLFTSFRNTLAGSWCGFPPRWVPLEVGIAMGCTISPSLFVMAMQILLKAAGSNIPEAHIGKGVYMPPIKAFMDDTTLIMNRKKVVQNTLDKLNNPLGWCRMAFKPAKSRSLALVMGKIRRDVFFDVVEQRIPTVSEEPVKSLGRVFDESLTDKSMRGAILQQTIEGLQAIEAAPLQGRFKVWMFQFVLLPRLLWPLTVYKIGLSVVEKLEGNVNRYTRKWLGLPPALSSVALYIRSTNLRLPLRSIVEEYKLSKLRTQWMLNNSADSRIREVKPLLRSGRKFREQKKWEVLPRRTVMQLDGTTCQNGPRLAKHYGLRTKPRSRKGPRSSLENFYLRLLISLVRMPGQTTGDFFAQII